MAQYTYQGQKYTVDDSVPQEEAIRRIKAHVAKSSEGLSPQTKESLKKQGSSALGVGETALSMLTGGLAQPIAGLAGLGASIFQGGEKGGQTVRDIQEALTYSPRTEKGQQYTQKVSDVFHMPIEAAGKAGEAIGGNAGRAIGEAGTEIAMNFIPLGAIAKGVSGRGKAPKFDPGVPKAATPKPMEAVVPEQLELPLQNSPQQIAEMQARATGQRDLFGPTNEPLARNIPETSPIEKPAPIETIAQQELFDQPEQGRVANPYEAAIGEWRVDENGMPVRADLSMEAANLENPLQMNLWGDELQPHINPIGQSADLFESQRQFQEQPVQADIPLTQAMDSMEPSAMRAAVEQTGMGRELPASPELQAALMQAENQPMGSKNPSMFVPRSQRGAVDVTQFLDGIKGLKGRLVERLPVIGDKLTFRQEYTNRNGQIAEVESEPYLYRGRWAIDVKVFDPKRGDYEPGQMSEVSPGKYIISPIQRFFLGNFEELKGVADELRESGHGTTLQEIASRKNQRGAINLEAFTNRKKQEKVNEILNTKQFAPTPKPDDVIAEAIADGKDSSGTINFSAGSTLEALKRKSPLIQGVSRIVQGRKNVAENNIRETVLPFEKAVRSLSRQETQQLAQVLKAEMLHKARFSMDELAAKGLTEKQLLAYQKTRDMFDAALAEQNRVRQLKGQKPITANEAYLSSRWQGDFRRAILDKEGKLVWYLVADNKLALNKQEKAFIKEFPELYGSSVDSHIRSSRSGNDPKQIYTTMLDVLGRDDPAVQKIAAWVEQTTMGDTSKALGQEKHFEPKANIRGFVGDRPGFDPVKDAYDMFQQQATYAKNAHNWSALQEAGLDLKQVFSDSELSLQQPKNMQYAKEYFADQLGFNEHQSIKALEDSIRGMGISPNQLGRGAGNIKSIWVAQKLAVNAGFVASNLIQAGNILPHLVDLQKQYGGNPLSALSAGLTFGPTMAIAHIAGKESSFIKTLSNVPGYTPFMAKAMKYAEDNSIISRTLADESPIESSFGAMNTLKRVGNFSINAPESVLRATTYMTYVEQLRSSGKFKGRDLELFRVAEERTNVSMGDYRQGEKAPIFNKLGQLGNSMNVLTTFPINYYNQWSWAMREAGRSNPWPALTMFAVQGYMAGLMGVPGFAEADKIVEFLKDQVADWKPEVWAKMKDFSLKRLALDTDPSGSLLYGPLSVQTDIGLTSRAAAPIPSEMVQTPIAPFVDLAKQAGSVANAAISMDDPQKWAQALYNVTPTGLQGYLETGPLKDFTSVQRGDQRLYGKPTDMSSRTGMYARNAEEEFLRSIGLRSQKEVVSRELAYQTGKHSATAAQIIRELPGKIYNQLRNENIDKAKDFIKLYAELSGKPVSREQLETQLIQEFTTAEEKLSLRKSMPLEHVLAVKRLRDTLTQMGYK